MSIGSDQPGGRLPRGRVDFAAAAAEIGSAMTPGSAGSPGH